MSNLRCKVWDNINKQMLPVVASIHFDKNGEVDCIDAGKTTDFLMDGWTKLYQWQFELLLWTDYTDINQKCIFDGDIIKSVDHQWVACVIKGTNGWEIKPNKTSLFSHSVIPLLHSRLEIIGNKFENSELLKDGK